MPTTVNRIANHFNLDMPSRNFERSDQLYSKIVEYASVQLNETLRKSLESIEKRLNQREEQLASLRNQEIKVRSQLSGAMDVVAEFAFKNRESIQDVFLGWADSEFRFVVVSKASAFDWKLCDKLTLELEAVLLEDYKDIPVSCQIISSVAQDDLRAILEHRLSKLNWNVQPETSNAERK